MFGNNNNINWIQGEQGLPAPQQPIQWWGMGGAAGFDQPAAPAMAAPVAAAPRAAAPKRVGSAKRKEKQQDEPAPTQRQAAFFNQFERVAENAWRRPPALKEPVMNPAWAGFAPMNDPFGAQMMGAPMPMGQLRGQWPGNRGPGSLAAAPQAMANLHGQNFLGAMPPRFGGQARPTPTPSPFFQMPPGIPQAPALQAQRFSHGQQIPPPFVPSPFSAPAQNVEAASVPAPQAPGSTDKQQDDSAPMPIGTSGRQPRAQWQGHRGPAAPPVMTNHHGQKLFDAMPPGFGEQARPTPTPPPFFQGPPGISQAPALQAQRFSHGQQIPPVVPSPFAAPTQNVETALVAAPQAPGFPDKQQDNSAQMMGTIGQSRGHWPGNRGPAVPPVMANHRGQKLVDAMPPRFGGQARPTPTPSPFFQGPQGIPQAPAFQAQRSINGQQIPSPFAPSPFAAPAQPVEAVRVLAPHDPSPQAPSPQEDDHQDDKNRLEEIAKENDELSSENVELKEQIENRDEEIARLRGEVALLDSVGSKLIEKSRNLEALLEEKEQLIICCRHQIRQLEDVLVPPRMVDAEAQVDWDDVPEAVAGRPVKVKDEPEDVMEVDDDGRGQEDEVDPAQPPAVLFVAQVAAGPVGAAPNSFAEALLRYRLHFPQPIIIGPGAGLDVAQYLFDPAGPAAPQKKKRPMNQAAFYKNQRPASEGHASWKDVPKAEKDDWKEWWRTLTTTQRRMIGLGLIEFR